MLYSDSPLCVIRLLPVFLLAGLSVACSAPVGIPPAAPQVVTALSQTSKQSLSFKNDKSVPGPTTVVAPSPTPKVLTARLDCVKENFDGSLTAYFGYHNPGVATTVPVGPQNQVSAPNNNNPTHPQDSQGQPTTFAAGATLGYPHSPFKYPLPENGSVVWHLKGTQATANKQSLRCSQITPVAPPAKWTLPLGLSAPAAQSAPVLTASGNAYFIGGNGQISQVNLSTGQILSQFQLNSSTDFRPLIDSQGHLYVGGHAGKLNAFNPDGSPKWTFTPPRTEAFVRSGAALGDDGSLYLGGASGYFYALNPDGTLKWEFEGRAPFYGSPVYANGKVFATALDQNIYALDAQTGEWLWEFQTSSPIFRSSPAGDRERLYFGSEDAEVYAMTGDGSLLWTYVLDGPLGNSPVVDEAGSVYFASRRGTLYSLNSQGNLRWTFQTQGSISSTPVIGNDGTTYLASADGFVYALAEITGEVLWKYAAGAPILSDLSMTPQGLILATDATGKVHALPSLGTGLAASWSKANGNAQNTGRVTP